MIDLNRIDSQFRILTDKLFFTDRTDLDVSDFKKMLDGNPQHHAYLWDRFNRSSEIFWDEAFWTNRFELLLSLDYKSLDTEIGNFLLARFRRLIEIKMDPNPSVDADFIQYIAWTKVRMARKDDVMSIREFFINLIHSMKIQKITNVIQHFLPHLFQDMNDYLKLLGEGISQSAKNFEVLRQLEQQGVPIDRGPIFKLAANLLLKRAFNRPNRRALFSLLDDETILNHLKAEYKTENDRPRLMEFIESCEFKELEEYHLRNFKNLLELDISIIDELFTIYADKLYTRGMGHQGANVKRLIRLCKLHPVFSPKKALVYLSTNSKMSDIKHLISAFPEIKPLAPFV